MSVSSKPNYPVCIGVFLTSMAILSLEVLLTRIFSFSIWYHFAYLTISMALLGFGASGAVLAAFPGIIERGKYRLLVVVSLLSASLIIITLLVFSRNPLQPSTLFSSPIQFFIALMIYYIGITLPFFFAGMAIAASLALFYDHVSYLYFFDLCGAGVGCLLSLLLINWLGAPAGVMVSALLMLMAACCFASRISKGLTVALALLGLLSLSGIPYVKNRIAVIPCDQKDISKLYRHPDKYKSLFSKWNAINRVDVYDTLDQTLWSCLFCKVGLSGSYRGSFPAVHTIVYDSHNGSNIYQLKETLNEFSFLDHHILKTPYLLLKKPEVLIIGVGGGIDVFNALKNEASSVTAVELQPITVSLLKGEFSEWVGNIYHKEKHVKLIAGEGRNYINRHKELYDLIQITTTDTFAALNTGMYILMESYLYTVDAVSSYFDRLTEEGLLCIIIGDMVRDSQGYQPLNARLILQYLHVLKARGIDDPQRHIAIYKFQGEGNIIMTCPLLKKTPFTPEDMATLESFAQKNGFYCVYDPLSGAAPESFLGRLIAASDEERKGIGAALPYNITPCTDNNPFYFNFIKWKKVFDVFDREKFWYITPVFGQAILLLLLIQSIVLSVAFIILPLFMGKKTRLTVGRSTGYLAYFFCIGIGFMFLEISFIQKFVLFLGYPAYAFAITIFSLLTFSGLGSYWTGGLEGDPAGTIKKIIFILISIVLLYTWMLPRLFDLLIGERFIVKALVAVLCQMPLGLVLGMFFPLGIKLVNRVDSKMVPWAWGVNGMSSVVSTVLAIMLAMNFGFNSVSYLAIMVYLAGAGSILAARRAAV